MARAAPILSVGVPSLSAPPPSRLDVEHWSDANKVILGSGIMVPFALGWSLRLGAVRAEPSLATYIDPAFLPTALAFTYYQLGGHVLLVLLALALRRRRAPIPWLVHAEIQHWFVCTAVSMYIVGPFTSSFAVLFVTLPVIGYLVFDARAVTYGVITGSVGTAIGVVLPILGLAPYAPFVHGSPVIDGRLSPGWIASVGVPSVFAGSLVLFVFTALLRRVRARQAQLETLGRTDVLTGLANRGAFFERLAEEVERAGRHVLPLSVLVIDVDHFKSVNDRFGHLVGDQTLRALAQRLAHEGRTSDLLARYGGEELTMVLPHTNLDGASVVAERLRAAAREVRAGDQPITVSIGVAQLAAKEGGDGLIARADAALYEAKRGGRDRVVVDRSAGASAGSRSVD